MKNYIEKSWQWTRDEWRRNAATMKTRGFWIVNAVWFAAGGLFFQLLPQRDPTEDELNYLLNQVLLIVTVLPIYFSELLTLSNFLNRAINRITSWINSKP